MRNEEEVRRALAAAQRDLEGLHARLALARRRPMVHRDALEEATLSTSIQLVTERITALTWVLEHDAPPPSSEPA